MKKTITTVVVAVLVVSLVCGAFYLVKRRFSPSAQNAANLTQIQKINTRNLTDNYPASPREVIKFYNKVIGCYYGDDYTDDEIQKLTAQAWLLFDPQLQEQNPPDSYLAQVLEDVQLYKDKKKEILQLNVCATSEVRYITDKATGDELAYVKASYFTKENKDYNNTYQMYVLRKDTSDKWKILVYYPVQGDTEEE